VQVCVPKVTLGTNNKSRNFDSYAEDGFNVYYHPLVMDRDIPVDAGSFLGFKWLKIPNNIPIPQEELPNSCSVR